MTNFGPCLTAWDARFPCDVSAVSPTVTGIAVRSATVILWAMTGRRYDQCTVKLRPQQNSAYWYPYLWYLGEDLTTPPGWVQTEASVWGNAVWDSIQLILPVPCSSIVEVKIDGTAMATGSYKLWDDRTLIRTDGYTWPSKNSIKLDDTQVGTWSITGIFGESVPELGELACGELACEIIKAMNDEECKLPSNILTLARQGMTVQYPDVSESWRENRLGLTLCDLFIQTENPSHLRRRARTYSVDGQELRRLT